MVNSTRRWKKTETLGNKRVAGVDQGVTRARNRDQMGKMDFGKGSEKAKKSWQMARVQG